jgi:tetratricopeptide (TPR) repeat protein
MRAAILGLTLVLVGGVAQADAGGARSHFLSGLQLYSQGKYTEALGEYQAAWVQWEDPELLLDMAECNRHLGKLDEAREQYRGFLERAPHSPLRGSVERQLARLERQEGDAPPPAELVAVAPPVERTADRAIERTHPGRTLMALGVAGWTASVVALGLAIYTSSQTSALEGKAHMDLEELRASNLSSQNQSFFLSPSCSPPSSLMGSEQYRSDCNRGQQYNAATTGLLISSLVVGAAGTASFIVGARQASRARGIEVQPAISYNAASLQLRFPF